MLDPPGRPLLSPILAPPVSELSGAPPNVGFGREGSPPASTRRLPRGGLHAAGPHSAMALRRRCCRPGWLRPQSVRPPAQAPSREGGAVGTTGLGARLVRLGTSVAPGRRRATRTRTSEARSLLCVAVPSRSAPDATRRQEQTLCCWSLRSGSRACGRPRPWSRRMP